MFDIMNFRILRAFDFQLIRDGKFETYYRDLISKEENIISKLENEIPKFDKTTQLGLKTTLGQIAWHKGIILNYQRILHCSEVDKVKQHFKEINVIIKPSEVAHNFVGL